MDRTTAPKSVSADMLKWIAIITMFIDHIGAAIVEKTDLYILPYGQTIDYILRYIGRLAFPIFCFLLVEGFYHTRSRKKYLCNLLIFAVISEIPFELSFLGELVWGLRNVYWTLAIGLLMLILIEKAKQKWGEQRGKVGMVLLVVACALLAEALHTDYGAVGILLIFILYQTRDDRMKQCILGAIAMSYEITAPIVFVFIYFYNGIRRQKGLKYLFYAFYPLHLLLLYLIRLWIV